jgi:hypothetical protein
MRKMSLFFFASVVFIYSQNCFASISQISPKCEFIGEVESVTLRKEQGRGISEGKTFGYVDVSVKVAHFYKVNDAYPTSCNKNKEIQTFQIKETFLKLLSPSLPKKGQCIKASVKFSGDGNFMSGSWLTIIEELKPEDCN